MPQAAGTNVRAVEPEIAGTLDKAQLKLVFRARVLKKLEEKDWTFADLGRHAGNLPRDLISTYLRDPPRSLPTSENLLKIAQALGCSPEELLPTATNLTALPPMEVVGQGDDGFRVKINIPLSLQGFAKLTRLIEEEAGAAGAGRARRA